ncbi:helix-turn-helix domain-containing protein [Nonomuraea sp. NPDC052116]|uniref:helix-turn-helix domain-containing protein n=1 Tax=Nonomuraea sp. NPDC052116 TaxID=3155665 RepID=UPI003437D21D
MSATVGYDAPLSLVARTAGVGQGGLYRHFPDRLGLVLAVFNDGAAVRVWSLLRRGMRA